MNDTPRTDAFWDRMPFGRPFLSEVRKFARQLERELDNMTDQRDAAIWCHEKCREDRLRVIEQRDRLAEAAHYMRQAMKENPSMWNYAIDLYESTINQIKQNNE